MSGAWERRSSAIGCCGGVGPVGLARRAEPDPGLSVDWTVLSIGAAAIVLVVLLSAAMANLGGVRSLPRWLAAFVALLGVASLGHILLTTLRRSPARGGHAQGLGLTRSQVLGCIIWQATTIALVGLVIGVPLGLIAGEAAWFAVADPIGVATDVDRPFPAYAATVCVALVGAATVALLPGWRAARLGLTDALRAE